MTNPISIATAMTALADPTRRALIEGLRNGPLPVGDLARTVPVSRPAVSQHLRVLTEAGLLVVAQHGTRRLYSISPDGVAALRAYLDALWDDALTCTARTASQATDCIDAQPASTQIGWD
jgi:DNA-binding transcriptional ArsR family regulator